jgi:biotin carboxylase
MNASRTEPLLVLGASEEQLPIYREARRRGLRTIAVDQRRDRPALAEADAFIQVSTRDHRAIAAALDGVVPTAVVSGGSDASLMSWHELSALYRTPLRYPRKAAAASMDKAVFHEIVRRTGLAGYRWVRTTGADEPAAAGLDLPVVVKPADASGSKGTTLVTARAELAPALAYAAAYSVSGGIMIEEFVAGRNLTVEVFLRRGSAIFSVITEKRLLPGPGFLIGGHTCPAVVGQTARRRVVEIAVRLCEAMDLTDGFAHFDVILAADGTPYLLEVGARLCGNGYPRLMRAVYGVDTVAAQLDLVLGRPSDLRPERTGHGIIHVLTSPSDREGVLADVKGLDKVRALPGVADVEVVTPIGGVVRPFTDSGNKLGYVVVTGDTPAAAEARLTDALDTLELDIMATGAAPTHEGPG